MLLLAVINLRGVGESVKFNVVLILVEVTALCIVTGVNFYVIARGTGNPARLWSSTISRSTRSNRCGASPAVPPSGTVPPRALRAPLPELPREMSTTISRSSGADSSQRNEYTSNHGGAISRNSPERWSGRPPVGSCGIGGGRLPCGSVRVLFIRRDHGQRRRQPSVAEQTSLLGSEFVLGEDTRVPKCGEFAELIGNTRHRRYRRHGWERGTHSRPICRRESMVRCFFARDKSFKEQRDRASRIAGAANDRIRTVLRWRDPGRHSKWRMNSLILVQAQLVTTSAAVLCREHTDLCEPHGGNCSSSAAQIPSPIADGAAGAPRAVSATCLNFYASHKAPLVKAANQYLCRRFHSDYSDPVITNGSASPLHV